MSAGKGDLPPEAVALVRAVWDLVALEQQHEAAQASVVELLEPCRAAVDLSKLTQPVAAGLAGYVAKAERLARLLDGKTAA